jgi:hypothetical protein
MDLDEPELSEQLPGESTAEFVGRIHLARRVLPILRDLVARRFAVVVESDRRMSSAASLTSDFVLEFGDARVRLILVPGHPDPLGDGAVTTASLAHYMLDVPDSDAIAVVADDDKLSTRVFDVYSLNSPAQMAAPLSLSEALDVYFEDIVHPIELPNFRAVLALPSNDQLESVLERDARAALERIRGSRARIEEKVTAIGLIGPEDSRRLVDILLHTMRTGQPSLSLLISEEADNND